MKHIYKLVTMLVMVFMFTSVNAGGMRCALLDNPGEIDRCNEQWAKDAHASAYGLAIGIYHSSDKETADWLQADIKREVPRIKEKCGHNWDCQHAEFSLMYNRYKNLQYSVQKRKEQRNAVAAQQEQQRKRNTETLRNIPAYNADNEVGS